MALNPEIEKMKEVVACRRCQGTGRVPKGLDMVDDLIAALSTGTDTANELDNIITEVLKVHGIKKSKQPFFRIVLLTFVAKIKHKAM